MLWRVRCRKLAANSEAIAEVHDPTVRILGAVVSAGRAWDPHIFHEALHDRKSFRARCTAAIDAKRCRRTSRRTAAPQEKLGKAQRCRRGQVPAAASLASSRDVE